MKVHMLTAIGGTPNIAPGEIVELEEGVALEWCDRQYAEPYDAKGKKAFAAYEAAQREAAAAAEAAAAEGEGEEGEGEDTMTDEEREAKAKAAKEATQAGAGAETTTKAPVGETTTKG